MWFRFTEFGDLEFLGSSLLLGTDLYHNIPRFVGSNSRQNYCFASDGVEMVDLVFESDDSQQDLVSISIFFLCFIL